VVTQKAASSQGSTRQAAYGRHHQNGRARRD